ncbi:hypothetical protein GCM10011581_43300 [Saccharopolyspora subtropica]|uniref:Uncharacterized protein n=1 Tax=Saccharopolyspora thermophila TaxID=89367 RepID=A0A917K8D7_9PSEU|nr:hypothetical protein [Saccharopolyspora subtropica]GGJ01444.1 hypothetical protein GCM10011581_43300 [Saccharopolyspora subtropica]
MQQREIARPISAGDVSGPIKITFYSTGHWFISTRFHDDGVIAGDSFALGVAIGDTGHGQTLAGELDADETKTFERNGVDDFVRANWHKVRNSEIRITLKVDPDIGEAIGNVVFGLAIAVFFAVVGKSAVKAAQGQGHWRRCPDQDPFDHTPCVEWDPNPPPPSPGP